MTNTQKGHEDTRDIGKAGPPPRNNLKKPQKSETSSEGQENGDDVADEDTAANEGMPESVGNAGAKRRSTSQNADELSEDVDEDNLPDTDEVSRNQDS